MGRMYAAGLLIAVLGSTIVQAQEPIQSTASQSRGQFDQIIASSQPVPNFQPSLGSAWWDDKPNCTRVWAEADYVIYWLKAVCLKPVTLTIGDPKDANPGVPGQPGTQVIQGGYKFQFDGADGFRPRLGAWLTEDKSLGVEVEGFVLEQVAAGEPVIANSAGPATYISYVQPTGPVGAMPFSVPGIVNASSSAVGSSHMWGMDANVLSQFSATERWGCSCTATFLAGCRYLSTDDRVSITNIQGLVADPQVIAIGQARFATDNQFLGGQVGSRFTIAHGPLAFDLTTKLAMGENHLAESVTGGPLLSGASVLPPLVPGPFLAQPTNVGYRSSTRISFIPEINLRLRFQVREHLEITLGYNALYWTHVLCPGDQMDPSVNTTQLPYHGPFSGARVPAPLFVFTDDFAQGLEAGVRFTF
jgi:Putative beta barrel porin-7 (BBP7)